MLHDELHLYRTQLSPTAIQMYNRFLVIILTVIAQALHDGTELRLGRVAIRKCLFNNVADLRLLLLAKEILHYLLCHLMRTPFLVVMVNLMPVGSHTRSNEMDMVVVRVMMGIDEQRLPFLCIPHLLEIAVCDVKQLLMGVLAPLAADRYMKLSVLDVRVPR